MDQPQPSSNLLADHSVAAVAAPCTVCALLIITPVLQTPPCPSTHTSLPHLLTSPPPQDLVSKHGGGQLSLLQERNRVLEEQVGTLSHQVSALQKSRDAQVRGGVGGGAHVATFALEWGVGGRSGWSWCVGLAYEWLGGRGVGGWVASIWVSVGVVVG